MKVELLRALQAWRAEKRPCAVVTHLLSGAAALVNETAVVGDLPLNEEQLRVARERIAADETGMLAEAVFIRVYAPPLRMIIVGAVHIAASLAPMAALVGFEVIVVDPREAFARSGPIAGVRSMVAWPDEAMAELKPDARTAIAALTHDPKLDDPALSAALRSNAFYVGALGSRKTHARRIERLKDAGFSDEDIERLHGPIGLDIGAATPAEIAVSIMAQVIADLRAEAA